MPPFSTRCWRKLSSGAPAAMRRSPAWRRLWQRPACTASKPTASTCSRSSALRRLLPENRTRCLEQLRYRADTVEVLSAGTQTSVGTTRDVWGTGRWVYRPRDRWMTGRCARATVCWAMPGRRCAGDHP